MVDPKSLEWRKHAHDVITELAKTNTHIVSDMVVAALEASNMGLDNYSVLGGVFKRAAAAGIIAKTDEVQAGNRKSHSAKTVWRSLIYKPATPVAPEQEALSNMITNALGFNAAVVRNASLIFAAGPGLKKSALDRQIKEFKKLGDEYTAQHIKIVERLEAQLGIKSL